MSENRPNRRLLPAGPTARALKVPAQWLIDEADAGRVPCLRIGRGFVLFDTAAVEQALLPLAQKSSPSPRSATAEGGGQ